MGKNKKNSKTKIRYKYVESKRGFRLDDVRCPVCKNAGINWIKVVQNASWNGKIILLAECWSNDTSKDLPKHLFLIELDEEDLPYVFINKISHKHNFKK